MDSFHLARRHAVLTIMMVAASHPLHAQLPSPDSPVPVLNPHPTMEATTVTVEGHTIAVTRAGAGPAIVLVHGGARSRAAVASWQKLQLRLAKRGTAVSVELFALQQAAGAHDADAARLAQVLHKLVAALSLQTPFVVANGAGVVIAYAWARAEPSAVRGLALLDVLVPGIAPWSSSPRERAWAADARRHAADRTATDTPLLFAVGENSPYAAQVAVHGAALYDHGWSRIDTALVSMSAKDVVTERGDEVADMLERRLF